jgi:hypothetical protein
MEFVEKADGTCVQLWYHQDKPQSSPSYNSSKSVDDEDSPLKMPNLEIKPGDIPETLWRVSTLGKITPDSWVPALFWSFFPTFSKMDQVNYFNLHFITNCDIYIWIIWTFINGLYGYV